MADRLTASNAARTGLSHARRMGAARGHLACVAAQSRRLAGKVSGDSVALCGDCPAARRARACAHSRRGREGRAACDRHSEARRRESGPGQLSRVADRPRLDARLRPDFCAQRRGPGGHHQLALQCLGQVFRLASRRSGAGPRGGTARLAGSGSRRSKSRARRSASGARRRVHRHQWRRAFCSPPKNAC